MGTFVGVIIVLFVLGSMMALKPNGIDQRPHPLRMTARRLQLNPKPVSCPDWIKGKDNEYGRGMLGQYCLVLDEVQLPHTRYQVIDGQWRPDSSFIDTTKDDVKLTIPSTIRTNNSTNNNTITKKTNFSLDKAPLDLPVSIEPFVKGLLTKANSIVIYWEDIAYVRPSSNPAYQQKLIEADLLVLKKQLEKWASEMQKQL